MKKLRSFAGKFVPSYVKRSYESWRILAKGYGHLESCRQLECRDAQGNPLPWYTYPAIDFLRGLDTTGMRVFEYGCGFSTLFWASKALSVVSVDDDKLWVEKVSSTMPANVSLNLVQDAPRYIDAINDIAIGRGESFDIVIIDAKHRYETARSAVSHVAPGGMLILDNADWYPETAAMLGASGMARIDMIGFGPINSYVWCTALFLKPDFRPKIIVDRGLIGGLACKADDDHPARGS